MKGALALVVSTDGPRPLKPMPDKKTFVKLLEPLRRMSGSEAQYQLNRMSQGQDGFADDLAVAVADGALQRFDVPDGKRFCTLHLYGWLASNVRQKKLTEWRVFEQGLDHSKAAIRRHCVRGLEHFPKEARKAARRRLDSPSAGTREAAVRLLRGIRDKKSEKDLKALFAKEKSKGVRKALEETLSGFGALTVAPVVLPQPVPSRFETVPLSPDSRLSRAVSHYVKSRIAVLVSTEEVAAALGISPAQAESELVALQRAEEKHPSCPLRWFRAHHVGWIYRGFYNPWHELKSPEPKAIDAYVAAKQYKSLDRLLASASRKAPPGLGAGGPGLTYRDGTTVSKKARDWILAGLFDQSATLVRAALSDEACGQLAIWLSAQKRPRKDLEGLSLLANDVFTDHIGQRYADRTIHVAHTAGWQRPKSPSVARWHLRYWRTIAAWSARLGGGIITPNPSANQERPLGAPEVVPGPYASKERPSWGLEFLEESFPHRADPSGSKAQWERWIAECLEQAMAGERSWSYAAFRRRYMTNPLACAAASGVVFELGEEVDGAFQVRGRSCVLTARGFERDGAPVDFPVPEGPLRVRVAHSLPGEEGWPAAEAPFLQRGRRAKGNEISAVVAPVSGKEWTRRLLPAWVDNGAPHGNDDFSKVRYDIKYYGDTKVHFRHTGYQFDAPVRLEQIQVDGATVWQVAESRGRFLSKDVPTDANWACLSPILRCEILRDLEALCAPAAQPSPSDGGREGNQAPAQTKSAQAKSAPSESGVAPADSGGLPDPTLELAKSSRSKCRGCRNKIEKGTWRLGDPYLVPGSSSGRTAMGWWHLDCALKNNKKTLARALALPSDFPDREAWQAKL